MATSNSKKIFFLGVNTGYVTDGIPDARFVEFYRRRASPELHCAIVGNVVVPGGYGSNAKTPVLNDSSMWATVANSIGERGSLPGIQLATAWEGYIGTRKFRGIDHTNVIAAGRQLLNDLGAAGIHKVLGAFDEAAKIAMDHGYRHVQIHGAHGYLLSLAIDGRINPNSEMVLNRLASLAVWLTSNRIESSIRISMRTGNAEFDAEGGQAFQDKVALLPFDYIDLSSGFYNIDKRLIYPSRPDILSERLEESRRLAVRQPQKAFILSGRAMTSTSNSLPPNLHIGLCRDLIANPQYLNDRQNGCQNRNKCHYFSRGEDQLTCALWKEIVD